MENNIETFEKELASIIEICDERIKRYKALLEEYEMIKGSALSLLNLNNNTKIKVVSLIDALKRIKYRFKISTLSRNSVFFLENTKKTSLRGKSRYRSAQTSSFMILPLQVHKFPMELFQSRVFHKAI